MLTGLVQVQLVQLYLNQLAMDRDAPIGDIHGKLMETCYILNENSALKILQGIARGIYGPVTALNKLIDDSRSFGFCLWHGSLSEWRDNDEMVISSMCPQCEKCPV